MLSSFRAIATAVLLAALPAAAAAPAPAIDDKPARVINVADGATLEVLVGNDRVRVRLAGIEVPGDGKAYSLRARQSLIAMCGGETARIKTAGKDPKGVVFGHVTCNGRDASAGQVRLGVARTIGGASAPVRQAQDEAKAARRGIWAPTPPQQR